MAVAHPVAAVVRIAPGPSPILTKEVLLDQKNEKKPVEKPEPKIETPLEEADLDIVTGGLISGGGTSGDGGSCLTSPY